MIRDRIVVSIRDETTRHKLLQVLAKAIDVCTASQRGDTSTAQGDVRSRPGASEAARRQLKAMSGPEPTWCQRGGRSTAQGDVRSRPGAVVALVEATRRRQPRPRLPTMQESASAPRRVGTTTRPTPARTARVNTARAAQGIVRADVSTVLQEEPLLGVCLSVERWADSTPSTSWRPKRNYWCSTTVADTDRRYKRLRQNAAFLT